MAEAMTPASSRGRVVMLGDDIRFDSRVQKEAKSMAARGWDVTVVGRKAAGTEVDEWKIGAATVKVFPMPTPLRVRRFEFRRAPLRSPLSYLPGRYGSMKLQLSKARVADLGFRRARLVVDRPRLAGVRRLLLGAQMLLAKLHQRWVKYRVDQTHSLRSHRRSMDGVSDRVSTWWWQRAMGVRAWRRLDPGIWDREIALGEHIDELRPDLIHANDFRNLHLGVRAVARARAQGRNVKLVWDAHEFLPGMKPWSPHPRWHLAQRALEREFAPYADSVVTVSEPLAELLVAEHDLPRKPAVVLNAPILADRDPTSREIADVRSVCGLDSDIPLLVYSGTMAVQRGLDLMVRALPELPQMHIVFVASNFEAPVVLDLIALATKLEVRDRMHLAPYVAAEDIVDYLSAADIGVIPIHHWTNHEISLITKFFEYSHARLPILVSDVKTMADMVRRTGQGEVFVAEDVDDLVRTIRLMLTDLQRYRRAYDAHGLLEEWTWEKQADELDRVYAKTLSVASNPVPV